MKEEVNVKENEGERKTAVHWFSEMCLLTRKAHGYTERGRERASKRERGWGQDFLHLKTFVTCLRPNRQICVYQHLENQ